MLGGVEVFDGGVIERGRKFVVQFRKAQGDADGEGGDENDAAPNGNNPFSLTP
jgi:hypothetical protein